METIINCSEEIACLFFDSVGGYCIRFFKVFSRESGEGEWERVEVSRSERGSVRCAWVGGRWSEGIGRATICRANDRADKRLGAGAKQRHEAHRCLLGIVEPIFYSEDGA